MSKEIVNYINVRSYQYGTVFSITPSQQVKTF